MIYPAPPVQVNMNQRVVNLTISAALIVNIQTLIIILTSQLNIVLLTIKNVYIIEPSHLKLKKLLTITMDNSHENNN